MNFFRLRVINTLLLFVAGIVLGFLIKDKLMPGREPAPVYEPQVQRPADPQPEDLADDYYDGDSADARGAYPPEPPIAAEEPAVAAEPPPYRADAAAADTAQVVIETEEVPVIEPSAPRKLPPGPPEDAFFSDPAAFEGRTVELRLQMITAKKIPSGWRLNLVHSSSGKRMEYLYVDDAGILPAAPDLRIGYFYKVRFLCSSGSSSAGNRLSAINATGEKASWATGLSAVE